MFDLGGVVGDATHAARGEMGRLWCLETDRGTWAVKELFWEPDPTQLEQQVRLVEAASAAGVIAPRSVDTIAGQVVASFDADPPVRIRVSEWIVVEEHLAAPVPTDLVRRAGEVLGRIHGAGEPTETRPDDWYLKRFVGGEWGSMIARLASVDPELAARLDAAMPTIRELESVLTEQGAPWQLCHNDFDPSNVLIDRDGAFVVIDWDNVGPLDPRAEIAYALLSWCAAGNGEPDRARLRAFLEGYGRVKPVPEPGTLSVFTVAIATSLNFVGVNVERVVDTSTTDEDRDRGRALLPQLLGTLPQVARLQILHDEWSSYADQTTS